MENTPYLIFRLHGMKFGVKATSVQQIISLPELTPLEESPHYVAGVLNLRGRIVPVIDLDMRFNHPSQRYEVSDAVVVLEASGASAAVIVSEVMDMVNVSASQIEGLPAYMREGGLRAHLLEGEAKLDGEIVMLLNIDSILEGYDEAEKAALKEGRAVSAALPVFCPEATPDERAVLRKRALEFAGAGQGQAAPGMLPVAVVRLGGEYYGIDTAPVLEFTDVRNITPVPCTGAHIIGNMSLRGNILTVVDVRNLLNIPVSPGVELGKAVVTSIEGQMAGVGVEEIFDVMYIRETDITAAPAASESVEKYVRGVAPYNGRMMTVIDISKILAGGELTVNEDV